MKFDIVWEAADIYTGLTFALSGRYTGQYKIALCQGWMRKDYNDPAKFQVVHSIVSQIYTLPMTAEELAKVLNDIGAIPLVIKGHPVEIDA